MAQAHALPYTQCHNNNAPKLPKYVAHMYHIPVLQYNRYYIKYITAHNI